ncbi:TPA: hypothetical protein IGZ62_004698, partial [Escherichia coli]|nr:hypothetical protein [Escherichia coli]
TTVDPLGLKFKVEGDRSAFDSAIEYLKQDDEMKKIITALEKDKHTIVVSCNNNYDNSFNRWTMRIHWDPKAALLCTGVQKDGNFDFKNDNLEPAVALGHEIAHAEAYLNEEFSVYMKRVNTPDPIYDNAEERRVITGIEKHVAQTLKQCVRKNHGGIIYHVP